MSFPSSQGTSEFSSRTALVRQVLSRRRSQLSEDIGAAKVLSDNIVYQRSRIQYLSELSETLEIASGVLTSIGEARQREAQEKIEALVTQGLQKVFGDNLSFHVVQSVKAKAPVVDFFVQTRLADGTVRQTPLAGSMGGGVCAVAGFLLRLVVLLLSSDGRYALLVLDETFAHVSDSYVPILTEFIREVVDKSKIQVLMVTHQPEFASGADKVYTFNLNSHGYTVITET